MTEFEGFWLVFCISMIAIGIAASRLGDGREP